MLCVLVPRAVGMYDTEHLLVLLVSATSVQDVPGVNVPVPSVMNGDTVPAGDVAPAPDVSLTVAVHTVVSPTTTVPGRQATAVLVERGVMLNAVLVAPARLVELAASV